MRPIRTVDGKMDPTAIVKGVILLVQHEHFALVPALVLRADLLQPQGCFIVKTCPACRKRVDKSPGGRQGEANSTTLGKGRGPIVTFRPFPMAGPQNNSWHQLQAAGGKGPSHGAILPASAGPTHLQL